MSWDKFDAERAKSAHGAMQGQAGYEARFGKGNVTRIL